MMTGMAKPRVQECVFKAFPELVNVQMNKLNRKFLIQGSGKTRVMERAYSQIAARQNITQFTTAGFKTGDLRKFNYDFSKYAKKEKVTPFDFYNDTAGPLEKNYGIFTLDGIKQAKASPFWLEMSKNEANSQELLEIAMEALLMGGPSRLMR